MPKISEERMEARKKLILESAFYVFSEKGFTQASMEDIVKHSGISKGGLYNYFKSKEEIFLAIAEQRFHIRNQRIIDMPEGIDAAKQMYLYLRGFLEGLQEENVRKSVRFTIEFWSLKRNETGYNEIASERYGKFERDLEKIINLGIKEHCFRSDLDIKSVIYIILATLDGLGFMDSVMGIRTREAIINDYVQMILNYLKGD